MSKSKRGFKPLTKWRRLPGLRWVRLEFKLQDLWIGAYWTDDELWVCPIPCFPIHIMRSPRDKEWRRSNGGSYP